MPGVLDQYDVLQGKFGDELPGAAGVEDFRERIAILRGKAEGSRISFLPWNMLIPLTTGDPLDFHTFPFQREWYSDEIAYTRFVNVMKSTQCGASEWAVRMALFFPDTRGDRTLYVFPALRQLRDFSDERVRPLTRTFYLRSRIPRDSIDNKMLKTIGPGAIYARGSKNATDLDSIPADGLFFDEYDDIEQSNVPRAEKRLSGPHSRGLIRRLGVPRYSDTGIHLQYELSDQRRWHVRCRKCKTELPLHFYRDDERGFHYVDVERGEIVCAGCGVQIQRRWIAEGRWIAEHPERETVGYHVNRLMIPSVRLSEVIEESKRTKPFEVQEFWNSTLGLPFDPEEGRLSRQAIAAAQSASAGYWQPPWDAGYVGTAIVTAGVDVASVRDLNVVVCEHLDGVRKRALFVGTAASFDQLAVMLDAWKVQIACIDSNPDGRLARAMALRFPGRAWVVSWGDNQRELMMIDPEQQRVTVRRTETIGATLDSIRTQRTALPMNLPDEYVRRMRSAVLKQDEDEKGRVTVFYEKYGDDDYLQASGYELVAAEVYYAMLGIDQASREVLQPLDSMLEFVRTRAATYEQGTYSPGPTAEPVVEPFFPDEEELLGGWEPE
jgi:hypothetical protein